MSKFFQSMVANKLIIDWVETLDWLFDEGRFDFKECWSRGRVGNLTKKIKRMEGFSEGKNYHYCKKANFESVERTIDESQKVVAIFSHKDSECRDFIRHIRNGIAHGRTRCFKVDGELYIEIADYDSEGGKKTAYFRFPISYIPQTYKLCADIEKSFRNERTNKKERGKF